MATNIDKEDCIYAKQKCEYWRLQGSLTNKGIKGVKILMFLIFRLNQKENKQI